MKKVTRGDNHNLICPECDKYIHYACKEPPSFGNTKSFYFRCDHCSIMLSAWASWELRVSVTQADLPILGNPSVEPM